MCVFPVNTVCFNYRGIFFSSQDQYWTSVKRPLHLLYAILSLLNKLVAKPSLVPLYERYVLNLKKTFLFFDCFDSLHPS